MPPDPTAEDDTVLLREYCADRAEPAFRALVERHLPAVWSAARRIVNGDDSLAEDIAQEVFAHLAVYAAKLPPRVVLGGWLHRHTCFTAAKAVRAASRRRAREQQAAVMNAPDADPWPDIAPHLDAALNSLSPSDRDAVVLRFFEKRDFRAIATALGTSEDAARMKTSRAVEKLRGILGKRSALLTVTLLTALLGEKSIAAQPAHLAAHVVQSSLAHAATVPAATGLTALLAKLRPLRPALIGGAVLCASGFVVWQWNAWLNGADKSSGPPAPAHASKVATTPARVNLAPIMDVAVRFILVPEAEGAALLADRWNGDGDSALLATLLQKAGSNTGGVQVAFILTGATTGSNGVKMAKTKEFPYPTEFDPGEKGVITPTDFAIRNVGSIAKVDLVVSADKEFCDLNLTIEHHYAEPEMHHWATSLAEPENRNLPGAKQPEFRFSKVSTQLLIKPGESSLAQSSQLPHLPDTPDQRLFVFVTVQSAAQP